MAVCLDLKRASYWQRSFVAQHPSLLQASRPLGKKLRQFLGPHMPLRRPSCSPTSLTLELGRAKTA